eukprot:CAMPEP_0181500212 /NCGR_PEP_ID=MMETSP1110-20121109/55094_1 /TAXON_ID=174948 /ORGANISM="Symbiodinium sp., Strain CCMP421" /LENGTH=57 /DNA_ID=CAMNT_0023628495 /DNA_START=99 /DNA_END=272 /DNA_ORIENTATION=+
MLAGSACGLCLSKPDVNPAVSAGTGAAGTVTGAGVGSWSSGGGSDVTSTSSSIGGSS